MKQSKLIFEKTVAGRCSYSLPSIDVPETPVEKGIPAKLIADNLPELPELSEPDVIRHYTTLSQQNFGVDSGFYPLGSCTMKYNPKINEDISRLDGFVNVHPYQPDETVQGCLEIIYKTERLLSEITGMHAFSLHPSAGAHGELTGLMIMKAYHEQNSQTLRRKIIVPDSAHGTNPASAAMVGYDVLQVKSNEKGLIDIKSLKSLIDEEVAGLMLTNPNTLGLFEEDILEISDIVHSAGGLLYYDGANANAILGIARPGDMGFDIIHLNLHKTFSTPHGGGGPGSGPVGVSQKLKPFLPVPIIMHEEDKYYKAYDKPLSIGCVKSFYGNFLVAVKAYSYMLSMGYEGLRKASESAVLNANYLMEKLKNHYLLPYERTCMHEFVLSAQNHKSKGISALDIVKNLIDFGFHPPTVYFPLIVKEALMIEPTETESKETLDEFIFAMAKISTNTLKDPEKAKGAPYTTPVGRLDEKKAVRNPILRWKKND